MRKPLLFALLFCAASLPVPAAGAPLDSDAVLEVMTRVCDWQLANLPEDAIIGGRTRTITDNGWIRAAFFTGVMAAHDTTRDSKYADAAAAWAERNGWQPAKRPRHADDHCAGQTYAELYLLRRDPEMLAPMRATFDAIVADPKRARDVGWDRETNWSWCDALFMAPPALARMSTATGDRKYLDVMNDLWWDTTDYLYDTEDHLYYRDDRYKIQPDGTWLRRTENDKKIFWSRGNGWVMGGIVRVLQHMPADYPDRPKYLKLFKEMSAKVATLQGADGLWRSSLIDPEEFPQPETSGSGFFCYALAWGVNQGILDKAFYRPVVEKAWRGLVDKVEPSGKLGWVQYVGADPRAVAKEHTMEYGSGALLLAGSEVIKLDMPRITVKNRSGAARPGEIVTLSWPELESHLPGLDPLRLAISEPATGKALLTQAVDTDSDGIVDEILFQADFAANETKIFVPHLATLPNVDAPSKTFARFVPERMDDFAWENDRIAFRMYGPGLQYTDDLKQRLTSSGIDVWCKKVRHLIVDKWYAEGNYHKDHGEGADFYKVGPARGCGGIGIWDGGKMHLSENYTDWRVIANGPIRTIFELRFKPWDVNGTKVSELKRVTLDAGSNLNRFDSLFETDGDAKTIQYAIGISKRDTGSVNSGRTAGHQWLRQWEPTGKDDGNTGCGIVVDGSAATGITEAEGHLLVIAEARPGTPATYYAGAGWDRSGDYADAAAWDAYLEAFSERLNTPPRVSIAKR